MKKPLTQFLKLDDFLYIVVSDGRTNKGFYKLSQNYKMPLKLKSDLADELLFPL